MLSFSSGSVYVHTRVVNRKSPDWQVTRFLIGQNMWNMWHFLLTTTLFSWDKEDEHVLKVLYLFECDFTPETLFHKCVLCFWAAPYSSVPSRVHGVFPPPPHNGCEGQLGRRQQEESGQRQQWRYNTRLYSYVSSKTRVWIKEGHLKL